ncbi:hypothetical protein HMN09_01227400 [Mycena chlorophos]|uniref:Uncharacterized protein n=1 Tax=Mycena chlorophos TaxID=658473 RepID=A0A8H6S4Z5_MYCCL|nr:hypothetical protein HMN09_01227400 [Mycena chlorophos]
MASSPSSSRADAPLAQSSTTQESPTPTISLADSTRFRTFTTPATPLKQQKTVVRSEPAILTNFDMRDYELYSLWAPKQ